MSQSLTLISHRNTQEYIAAVARRLHRQHDMDAVWDVADLQQELNVHLLVQLEKFDPKKMDWVTFLTRVLWQKFQLILREARRSKRSPARVVSLSGCVDEELNSLGELLADPATENKQAPWDIYAGLDQLRVCQKRLRALGEVYEETAVCIMEHGLVGARLALGLSVANFRKRLSRIRECLQDISG